MRSGLVSLLRAEGTVTAIVAQRVYVTKAPQTAKLPFVVIDQNDTEEFNSIDGTGKLRRMGFVVDCIASTSVEAETLGNAVREYLDDFTGVAGTFTVDAVMMNGEHGGYDPPNDGSDGGFHIITLDLDVFYQRP